MIYAAKIESGLVVQVTVESADFVAPEGWAVIGAENVVGIGWSCDGTEFSPPADPEAV